MISTIETLIYGLSQVFLAPVLVAVCVAFTYAVYALGAFCVQALQRRAGSAAGFELIAVRRARPALSLAELEALALQRLEFGRIVTRTAPMLGLVATMIPMGPALKSLGEGNLADIANNLMVAFSAVILSLIAATLTHAVVTVRRRWYAHDLLQIENGHTSEIRFAGPARSAAPVVEASR